MRKGVVVEIKRSSIVEGVGHIVLERHFDERGFFMETLRRDWFPDSEFVQSNQSFSEKRVLRGLHYHLEQEDLWMIPHGSAQVALVDLRASSPTFMAVEQFGLSGPNAVHVPIGVAHGLYAEEPTIMTYHVTQYYDGSDEYGVLWNDPDLAVDWPSEVVLSDRDRNNLKWVDVPAELRPR